MMQNTEVAIYSCDPNINSAFLARSRREGSVPVRVIKPSGFDAQDGSHVSDSGIVATRSARDIGAVVDACDRLAENDRKLSRYHMVVLLVGAVIGSALTVWNVTSIVSMMAVVLTQGLGCLIGSMMTRKNLSNEDETTKYDKK